MRSETGTRGGEGARAATRVHGRGIERRRRQWRTARRSTRSSGQLLEQETFPPPDGFRERAVVSDPSIYDEAEADHEGFWAEQAEALHWDQKWDQVLDWSDPPFAKWFVGGKLNVSYNCLDRHVEAGRGDRVAFHWRGEEGEERDITYADAARRRAALRQRAQGPRHRGRRRRRDLPADDPRGRRRDARLRAHRRGPQRRLRRLLAPSRCSERMEFSEAKALITVDGARRKGKTAPIKPQVDEVDGRARARDDDRRAPHGRRRARCATAATTGSTS